jgi:hypothetical protein
VDLFLSFDFVALMLWIVILNVSSGWSDSVAEKTDQEPQTTLDALSPLVTLNPATVFVVLMNSAERKVSVSLRQEKICGRCSSRHATTKPYRLKRQAGSFPFTLCRRIYKSCVGGSPNSPVSGKLQ